MSVSPFAAMVDAGSRALADRIVERHGQLQPDIARRYTPTGGGPDAWRIDWREDTRGRLCTLAEAVEFESPALFLHEMRWLRTMYSARGVPEADLRFNLEAMRDVLMQRLPGAASELASAILAASVADFATPARPVPSAIEPPAETATGPFADLLKRYLLAVLEGRPRDAATMVLERARAGTPVMELYRWVLEPAQHEIGRMWQLDELGVSDEHLSTGVTAHVMARLHEFIDTVPRHGGRLLATSVSGDLHDVGVRMVADAFELDGWQARCLGASTPVADVLEALERSGAELLAVGAKLTSHLRSARALVSAVRADDRFGGVKIIIGGTPFQLDPALHHKVGADGSAAGASEAVRLGRALTGLSL